MANPSRGHTPPTAPPEEPDFEAPPSYSSLYRHQHPPPIQNQPESQQQTQRLAEEGTRPHYGATVIQRNRESEPNIPPPRDYFNVAVCSTLCCCFLTGLITLVFSARTREAKAENDLYKAYRKSKKTKICLIITFVTGVCLWVCGLLVLGIVLSHMYTHGHIFEG